MNNSSELVINPMTQRPIKVGGRVYKKLIADGYIPNNNNTSKYMLKENTKTVDYHSDSDVSVIDYTENIDEDIDEDKDEKSYDFNYEDEE